MDDTDSKDSKDTTDLADLNQDDLIHVYKRRWLILFLFTSYSFLNAYQWIHLNIISEKVLAFWNQSLPGIYYLTYRTSNLATDILKFCHEISL